MSSVADSLQRHRNTSRRATVSRVSDRSRRPRLGAWSVGRDIGQSSEDSRRRLLRNGQYFVFPTTNLANLMDKTLTEPFFEDEIWSSKFPRVF